MKRVFIWIVLGLVCLEVHLVFGRTWVVASDGSGDFMKVSDGCAAAASGDTVAVKPGDYNESDHDDASEEPIMIQEKNIAIVGTGSSDVSVRLKLGFWECRGGAVSGLNFHDIPDPITIWEGYAETGSYAIQRCTFERTESPPGHGYGGALTGYLGRAVLTVEDCYFDGNVVSAPDGSGGAIWAGGGALSVRRSVFLHNRANEGGAIYAYDAPVIEDCLFARNVGSRGAALAVGPNADIRRSTFYRNACEGGACGAIAFLSNSLTPEDCIVAYTEGGAGLDCNNGIAEPACCDFWGNDLGTYIGWSCVIHGDRGNFEADPLFCNAEGGDFGLQIGSPCLPGQHGGFDCGLIGSGTGACGIVPIRPTTWGNLRLLYR